MLTGWRAAVLVLSLSVGCSPSPSGPAPEPVTDAAPPSPGATTNAGALVRTLELQGITFRVSCPNSGSVNELRIEPEGLAADNSPMVQEVNGTVTGAEVADLNADGSPEIYVFVQSAGSGSYGSLVAFSANNGKSLSGVYLPDITEDKAAAVGYMGHDQFTITGSRLVRRFPVYREGDPNAAPTGGTRQVEYRLVAGEAGWLLRVESVSDGT